MAKGKKAKVKALAAPAPIPPITDLADAYKKVLGYFSGGAPTGDGNYNGLAQYMHTDITVKKVARRDSIAGIGAVVSYLNNQMYFANPTFTPDTTPPVQLHPAAGAGKPAGTGGAARLGLAHGTGVYQDANTGVADPGITVRFCWTFVRDDVTGGWLLYNVYAHRTDL
jgi:hypothetical protein